MKLFALFVGFIALPLLWRTLEMDQLPERFLLGLARAASRLERWAGYTSGRLYQRRVRKVTRDALR